MANEDAVWLDVLPNMSKFGSELTRGADAEAGKAGKSTGRKFGLAAAAGVAAVAGGVVLAGKALYDLGATFDNVTAGIQTQTGATGAELETMTEAVKIAATRIPDDFEDIGGAISVVKTSMGDLAGTTAEDMADMAVNATNFSKAFEIDITRASQVAGQMMKNGMAKDGQEAFDLLTVASQKVPAALRENVLDAVDEYGGYFGQLGIGGEAALTLLTEMSDKGAIGIDKAGDALKEFTIRATDMSTASGDAYKAIGLNQEDMTKKLLAGGEQGQEAFNQIINGLKNMEDPVAQSTASLALFGTPLEDIGTSEIPAFLGALSGLEGGLGDIEGATGALGDTMNSSFGAQFDIFKNKLSVLFAPAAEKVFGILSQGMTWINDNGIPYIERLGKAWEEGTGPIGQVKDAFGLVWGVVQENVLPALGTLWGVIQNNVIPWLMTAAGVVADTLGPVFADLWRIFNEKVLPVLNTMWGFIQEKVIPTISYLANNIVLPLFGLIGTTIQTVWRNVISPALSSFWDFLKNYVGPAISWLWDSVVDPTFRWIGGAIKTFSDNWAEVWHGIQSAALAPVNFVIDVIYNQGIRKVLNLIPGVDLEEAQTIKAPPVAKRSTGGGGGARPVAAFQDGGYVNLPWDPNNRDPYLGIAPNGMFRFEGEEYVVKRSSTHRLQQNHPGLLDYINRHGDLPAHRDGGKVNLRGHTFTNVFAAALLAAEQAVGRTFRITQGGFRPRTSYSGTSHQGDAVDIARPYSTADIAALRMQGIAAWDRAGKGNWIDHIHGVPLPGYGRAAGSAVWQAQDYLKGGDGLGGRDNGPRVGVSGDGPGFFEIPGIIKEIVANMAKMVGPWGELFRGAVESSVEKLQSWVGNKLNELGEGLSDLIFGKQTKTLSGGDQFRDRARQFGANGYLTGTGWADPGLAYLSEDGMPELVVGPQLRNMNGGERVYSHSITRKLLGGAGEGRFVSGRLRIDEDGTAWVEGIVEDILDDRDNSADRWDRMGV